MKKWKYMIGFMVLASIFMLTGCQTKQDNNTKKTDKIIVMTTFYPMYNFTKEVVGKEGTVEQLIPAGAEPHDFEPSAKDIAKISSADVFVYNSHELETWVENTLENIDQKKVKVVEASQGIDLMKGSHEEEHEEDHDHNHELDPHVWLDPVLAQKEVEAIRDALCEKYPEKKVVFEKNATAYINHLKDLDQDYEAALKGAKSKTFVTQHAAFGYLAKRYGLHQESISGVSSDQEPSPSRLAELKKFVKENQIKVLYFESSASSKVAKTLSEETGVELSVLNTLEGLTKEEQKEGKDYLSVMKDNLEALKKSIQ